MKPSRSVHSSSSAKLSASWLLRRVLLPGCILTGVLCGTLGGADARAQPGSVSLGAQPRGGTGMPNSLNVSDDDYGNGQISCVLKTPDGFGTKWCAWNYHKPEPKKKTWRGHQYPVYGTNPGWFTPGKYWVKFTCNSHAIAPGPRWVVVTAGKETKLPFFYSPSDRVLTPDEIGNGRNVLFGEAYQEYVEPRGNGKKAQLVGRLVDSQKETFGTEWAAWSTSLGQEVPDDIEWWKLEKGEEADKHKELLPGNYYMHFKPLAQHGIKPFQTEVTVRPESLLKVVVTFSSTQYKAVGAPPK